MIIKAKRRVLGAACFLFILLAACSQEQVSVESTAASNLISNASFNGTGNWSFYVGSPMTGRFLVEDGVGKLNIQNSNGTYWKAQLHQDVAVQEGKRYTLSFKAKATASRPLQVAIRNGSNYRDSWNKTLNLTTSTKTFSYTFTASASNDQQLIFYAGQSGKDVFIDDVSLRAGGASQPGDGGSANPPSSGGGSGGKLAPSKSEATKRNNDMYTEWKGYVQFKGPLPLRADQFGNGMVSEGIGYGMLLAVLNDDERTFDRFWDFAESKLEDYDGDGVGDLLPWIYDSNGNVENRGNATDGGLDIAFSLLVADKKGWDGDYGSDARRYISNIMKWNVGSNNALQEGRWTNNGENVVNTSYQSPGYFKAFADYTGNNRWLKVRDKSYDILENGFERGYKVLPHNMNVNGALGENYPTYDSDAARGPWRLAVDYLWYGNDRAKKLLEEYNTFFEGEGLSNLCGDYDTKGNAANSSSGRWCGSKAGWMIGGAACAQVAGGGAKGEAWKALTNAYDGGYYSRELKALAMKMCSGYEGNPAK